MSTASSSGVIDKTVVINPNALVCKEQATIRGDVVIESRTITHPTVTIIAEKGPIRIGESNLIEEYVTIINRSDKPMIIGNYNVFEVGSYSESLSIGDNNVLEYRSRVGPRCFLTNGCIIGALCNLDVDEELKENTVIYGPDCKRRIAMEKPAQQNFQLDFLRKIMPNYQRLVQTSKPENQPTG